MQLILNRPMGSSISPMGSPVGNNNNSNNSSSNNSMTTYMSMSLSSSSGSKNDKDVAPFLKNLRKMLDEESDAILRWTPNGRAFEIHDMELMMDAVLPKYFKHRKYTSFQRQLNYFNFRKWTKSKAVVCTFSNDCFVRDQPELACRITRKKSLHHHSHSHNHAAAMAHQHQQLASPAHKPRPSRALSMPTSSTRGGNNSSSTSPYWLKNEGVVISVPRSGSLGDLSRVPFPSPTDQDMMLKEHDHAATSSSRRHYYTYPLQLHHSHAQAHFQYQHAHQQAQAPPPTQQYGVQSQTTQQQQYGVAPQMQQSPESLDWIDCLLPPVDRIEDEIYSYMYPTSSSVATSSLSAMLLGSGKSASSSPFEFTSTAI